VGTYDIPGWRWAISVSGNYVYLMEGLNGLNIIDISDPTSPILAGFLTGFFDPSNAVGINVVDNYAYIFAGPDLYILDITNPSEPILTGSIDTPGISNYGTISGNFAYITTTDSGLWIVDISDPKNPVVTGNLPMSYGGYAVGIAGDYAFMLNSYNSLEVINISDPSAPFFASSYYLIGSDGLVISKMYKSGPANM